MQWGGICCLTPSASRPSHTVTLGSPGRPSSKAEDTPTGQARESRLRIPHPAYFTSRMAKASRGLRTISCSISASVNSASFKAGMNSVNTVS